MSLLRYLLVTTQVTLLGMMLLGCSSPSSPVALAPDPQSPPRESSGVFQLATPTPTIAAGLLRFDIRSAEPLPETLTLQGVKYIRLPVSVIPGRTSYVAEMQAAFQTLTPITELVLPGVSQATVQAVTLPLKPATGERLYLGNQVTFVDFLLVYALTQLPLPARTAENIAATANTVFPSANVTPGSLNPLPSADNTNFVAGPETGLGPDFRDAVVVYAATQLPETSRTAENLAAVANAVFPAGNISPAEILAIPGVTPELPPSEFTIEWIGQESGNWDEPSNWSLGRVPNTEDRVRIAAPANVVITHRYDSPPIRSLVSHNPMVLAGGGLTVGEEAVWHSSLELRGGRLEVRGAATVLGDFHSTDGFVSVIGEQASFTPMGTVTFNGGRYYAYAGGQIVFPASLEMIALKGVNFLEAQDPGSRLELPGVTKIDSFLDNEGSYNGYSLTINAFNGGEVNLPALKEIIHRVSTVGLNGGTFISSQGVGSRINLAALERFTCNPFDYICTLSTLDGGNIDVSKLTELYRVHILVNPTGGVISTGQIRSLRQSVISLNGRSTDLSSLRDITGSSFRVSQGASQAIPTSIKTYKLGRDHGFWPSFEVDGPGSQLSLQGLTSINDQEENFGALQIIARNGGQLDLSGLTAINLTGTHAQMEISSTGLNSYVDLGSLQSLSDTGANYPVSLSTKDEGVIHSPLLVNLTGVEVIINAGGGRLDTAQIQTLRSGRLTINGQAADLSSLTNIANSTITVKGGVTQVIPATITSYLPSPNSSLFEVDGLGSRLSFLGLTSILDQGETRGVTIRAVNGGEIDLSTLTQIIHTGVSAESYIRAVGRNSLVNLGGLTRFITQGGTSELRVADNGTIQAPNLNQQQNLNVINDGGTIVLP